MLLIECCYCRDIEYKYCALLPIRHQLVLFLATDLLPKRTGLPQLAPQATKMASQLGSSSSDHSTGTLLASSGPILIYRNVECWNDLEIINSRLSSPSLIRPLHPDQLPSQAVSSGEETPTISSHPLLKMAINQGYFGFEVSWLSKHWTNHMD